MRLSALMLTSVLAGREDAAGSLFLEILQSPEDPYRWSAAGWMCGERRPILSIDWAPRQAAADDVMLAAWRDASGPVAECGRGRAGFVTAHLDVQPDGSVGHVMLVAAGWYDTDAAVDGTGESPYDPPTSQCVHDVLGQARLPSGVETARLTFPLR